MKIPTTAEYLNRLERNPEVAKDFDRLTGSTPTNRRPAVEKHIAALRNQVPAARHAVQLKSRAIEARKAAATAASKAKKAAKDFSLMAKLQALTGGAKSKFFRENKTATLKETKSL